MGDLLHVNDLQVEAFQEDGSSIPIVKDVSFSVKRGEILALIGESGSGKTTVALATMGYARSGCRITSGEVLLDGEDVLSMDPDGRRRLRGRRISYLAQSAAATFNPALTIGAQVTESTILHKVMSPGDAHRRAVELYRRLDLPDPENLGGRFPHQVSGGQLQRLMAARAMCSNPGILLLDEPTTALDVTTQIEVLAAFNDLIQEQGTAAIYVTHDLALVAQIADRVIVLYGGEMREEGDVDQIINRPSDPYTKTLMEAIRKRPVRSNTPPQAGSGGTKGEPPLMAVSNVDAGYGRTMFGKPVTRVLHDVSLDVVRGSVVGVIGESGCGKSTLARVIAGLLPASDGRICLEEKELPRRVEERDEEAVKSIQIVFQMADVALNPRQRIREIIGRPVGLFLKLRGKQRNERILELLDMVDLPRTLIDRFPEELSGGQKQRVNLARSLAAEPKLLLCDEVTSSLDTIVAAAVIELLKGLGARLGHSYVYISHDLSTVASFADHVVVLYAGHVVEAGPTASILAPPFHPYTHLLLSSIPQLRQGWLEEVMETRAERTGASELGKMPAVGCPFFERCPVRIDGVCDTEDPPIREPLRGHKLACHREIPELAVL
ncbi:MAG: ABC transporter ATP-binding protein [Gammaproteobacteria bacterium]|nr:ABC transporter ATP-binding protein [Gammaproteobacteria bacterium]